MKLLNPSRFILPLFMGSMLAVGLLSSSVFAQSKPTAFLSVQGQGMAPNQIVTLSTGPKQQLQATVAADGSVTFKNLQYTPDTNLAFSLSYSVKSAGAKMIPNSILMELDPFMGTVGMKGQASRAASVIVNVSGEDSEAIVANQNGYFVGSADSLSGFSKGNLRVVASIINVEESCCPRVLKPYAPVSISIVSQPVKKADAAIIRKIETVEFKTVLPEQSYGVSVPDSMIQSTWLAGFAKFGNQIVKSIQSQNTALGSFFDAQNNSMSLMALQKASATSAKNALLSEQLCRYGSLAQGLPASDALNQANKLSLNQILLGEESARLNSVNAGHNANQRYIDKFKKTNCDKRDANEAVNCKSTSKDTRYNMDVDYTSAIDAPLTLDINFADGTSQAQEEDVLSLAENLFPARPIRSTPESSGYIQNNADYRSLQAIRTVAKNSFISQVSEKSQGTAASAGFINKLMLALGVSEGESKYIMGENPSYYAQMEVLTKKLFQDPAFYVNLVDTPANVERQQAAIRALKLQQQNDFAQVVKRREMLLSVLLEMKLREREGAIKQRVNPKSDTPEATTTP